MHMHEALHVHEAKMCRRHSAALFTKVLHACMHACIASGWRIGWPAQATQGPTGPPQREGVICLLHASMHVQDAIACVRTRLHRAVGA